MTPATLFAYHAGNLVALDHQARTGTSYPVAALKAAGWKVSDEGLRASLPRFDAGPSLVAGSDASIKAAAAQAARRQQFEQGLKRGR